MTNNKDEFLPSQHIQLAADSVQSLREVDVYRLFQQCDAENYNQLSVYIQAHRPDLAIEVQASHAECLSQ